MQYKESTLLPKGKTCGDCEHFEYATDKPYDFSGCHAIRSRYIWNPTRIYCRFSPIKFKERKEDNQNGTD